MQNTTTTTTTTSTTTVPTAFAKELAMHGIVRVEFGTASAYWGHADVTSLEEARAAARQFFADAEKRRYCDSEGWHYPKTVGIRVYPTSFEAIEATTTTTTPDWGVAYCRGELLNWVAYRGECGGDVDGYLEGHYDSQAQAYAAMNAALECEYEIDCADLREEMLLEELEG
jgi:hypothetical protein